MLSPHTWSHGLVSERFNMSTHAKASKQSGSSYKETTYICKFCKVPVMSKTDTHSKLGHEHKKSCPRRGRL